MKDNDLKEIQGHLIAKYVAAQLGIKYWQYQLLTSFHFSPLFFIIALFLCVCVCVCVSVVSDSLRPHGQYPARFFCPWDFRGNNTGMGCHSLFQALSLLHLNSTALPPLQPPQKYPSWDWQWKAGAMYSSQGVYLRKQVCHFALVNSTTPHASCVPPAAVCARHCSVGACLNLWVQIIICTSWSQGWFPLFSCPYYNSLHSFILCTGQV